MSFKLFLKSKKLEKTDEGLFRNFRPDDHLPKLEKLLSYIKESSFLDTFLSYAYESDYDQQRLWEKVLFKGMYLSAYLADSQILNELDDTARIRYQGLSVLDYLDLVKVGLDAHESISKVWNLRNTDTLVNINHFLDVLIKELEDRNLRVELLLHESAYFLKENEKDFVKLGKSILKEENLASLKESLDAGASFFKEVSMDKNAIIDIIEHLEADNTINWGEVRIFLRNNGAKQVCRPESEGYSCRKNESYRELQKILNYLVKNDGKNLSGLLNYLIGENRLKVNELLNKIFPSINNEPL